MVRRLYTPPTCTLKVDLTKNRLDNGHFELRFDDPRQASTEIVTFQGDRTGLLQLYHAIAAYVQTLLHANASDAYFVYTLDYPSEQQFAMQPQGRQLHKLHLNNGDTVELTTLQLFDLVTALDDCWLDLVYNPIPQLKLPWGWGLTAAAVLASAFGLSWLQTSPPSVAEAPALEPSPQQPSSPPPLPVPRSTIPPLPAAPPLPPNQKLVAPPPVQVPAQSPNPAQVSTPGPSPRVVAIAPQAGVSFAPPYNPPPRIVPPSQPVSRPEPEFSPPILPDLPSLQSSEAVRIPPKDLPPITIAEASELHPGTLFDQIPQVFEVRKYFQGRWQPPQGLDQALEYSLQVNRSGVIERIIPLGRAAQTNIDLTGMPLINEPFVSAMQNNAQIRLVLTPEGGVQTFLESVN